MKTKAFSNSILDIFGFTGYSPEDNAIVVTFRSTVSVQNWIADLDAAQVSLMSLRSAMRDVKDVRFIKVSIMHFWGFSPILGLRFRNCWLCIEMLSWSALAIAWAQLCPLWLAWISTACMEDVMSIILLESLDWGMRILPCSSSMQFLKDTE